MSLEAGLIDQNVVDIVVFDIEHICNRHKICSRSFDPRETAAKYNRHRVALHGLAVAADLLRSEKSLKCVNIYICSEHTAQISEQ